MTDDLVKWLREPTNVTLGAFGNYTFSTDHLWLKQAAADRIEADAKRIAEAVKILDERDREYNRLTNEMIERHAANIRDLKGEIVALKLSRDTIRGLWRKDRDARISAEARVKELEAALEKANLTAMKRKTSAEMLRDRADANRTTAEARVKELEAALHLWVSMMDDDTYDMGEMVEEFDRIARAALEGEKKDG